MSNAAAALRRDGSCSNVASSDPMTRVAMRAVPVVALLAAGIAAVVADVYR